MKIELEFLFVGESLPFMLPPSKTKWKYAQTAPSGLPQSHSHSNRSAPCQFSKSPGCLNRTPVRMGVWLVVSAQTPDRLVRTPIQTGYEQAIWNPLVTLLFEWGVTSYSVSTRAVLHQFLESVLHHFFINSSWPLQESPFFYVITKSHYTTSVLIHILSFK